MACVFSEDTEQSYHQEVAQDSHEAKDTNSQGVFTTIEDYKYAIGLLLGALEDMAVDLAISKDLDPDYLIVKLLLANSLHWQSQRLEEVRNKVSANHSWLLKILNVNLTK